MRPSRAPRALLILAAVGVGGLFFARALPLPAALSLWRIQERPRKSQPFYAAPGTELTAARLVGRERGRLSWECKARRINRSIDGSLILADGIHDGKTYADEKLSCTFEAGRLVYQVLFKRLGIEGGLRGRLADGTVFTAERANVDTQRQTLDIPVLVKVDGPSLRMRADTLAADLAGQIITLRGQVEVAWSGGTLRAQEVVYNAKDGTFSVLGNEGGGVEITL